MIGENELIEMIGLVEADALRRWVDAGWILPQNDDSGLRFDESDVARVRLICELRYELRIEEDSMSVVLSLMDQVYGLRRSLGALLSAIEAEPADVRSRIAEHVIAER